VRLCAPATGHVFRAQRRTGIEVGKEGDAPNNIFDEDLLLGKALLMKKTYSIFLFAIIIFGVVIISAVCWHSVGEIHYLKSFFPNRFSVEEAYCASVVELIKVVVIALPIITVIGISLYVLRHFNKES